MFFFSKFTKEKQREHFLFFGSPPDESYASSTSFLPQLSTVVCHQTSIVFTSDFTQEPEHLKCQKKKTRECHTWHTSKLHSSLRYRYHWGIILGPKTETEGNTGMRFHAKESITEEGVSAWVFEEKESSLTATSMVLVRVMIAKVRNRARLISILRNVPMRPDVPGWNCIGWVKEALELLEKDGKVLGTSVAEWRTVRNAAMDYCQLKRDEHRFDGTVQFDMRIMPTYDLLERKETNG